METALIIIDVQKAMDHPKWGKRNNPYAEENMNFLLSYARKNKWSVFHIQDCSLDPSSPYRAGQPLHDFKEEVKPVASEKIIQKTKSNAFEGTELLSGLKAEKIEKFVVTGVHTQYCVFATVKAALKAGFTVTVVSDATVAVDMKDSTEKLISAEKIHCLTLTEMKTSGANIIKTAELII